MNIPGSNINRNTNATITNYTLSPPGTGSLFNPQDQSSLPMNNAARLNSPTSAIPQLQQQKQQQEQKQQLNNQQLRLPLQYPHSQSMLPSQRPQQQLLPPLIPQISQRQSQPQIVNQQQQQMQQQRVLLPPVANATMSQLVVNPGMTAILDGRTSYSPNLGGHIVAYQWDLSTAPGIPIVDTCRSQHADT